jgi:hypothetical protein
MQQNCPGGNNQTEHDNIFPCKPEIIAIDQVGQEVGKKIGEYRNQNIH